jgi:hypothetical protein
MSEQRCTKCGARLILAWIGRVIPWLHCPRCENEEA